jgi:hypothetical protein
LNALPSTLSAWRLREEFGLIHAQWREIEDWGLLPRPIEGRYPPETRDILERICEVSREVRPLPRRVLRLAADALQFDHVPAESVREAMIAVAPSIPAARMKRMFATRVWFEVNFGLDREGTPKQRERRALRSLQKRGMGPPPHNQWLPILRDCDRGLFADRFRIVYYFTVWLIPGYTKYDPAYGVDDIPPEERVTLGMILDMMEFAIARRDAALKSEEMLA